MCGVVLQVWGITLHVQERLSVKFRSRALLDVTVLGYGKESVLGYYRLEDFRVGFKAVYVRYEMKEDGGEEVLKYGVYCLHIHRIFLIYVIKHAFPFVLFVGNEIIRTFAMCFS